MAYKAADAKRKKKEELLEQKYHSDPRPKISTVVLKNNSPRGGANRTATQSTAAKQTGASSKAAERKAAVPASSRALHTHVGAKPKAQTLPYTGGQKTLSNGKTLGTPQRRSTVDYEGVRKNADYKTGAAHGWKAYCEDEEREQQLKRSAGYQRWTQAVGDKIAVESFDDTKPRRNWSFDQNNTFGYLYSSRDKTDAREYARLVNQEYRNKAKELVQGAWNTLKDSQSELAAANYQQDQAQTDWLKQAGQRFLDAYADSARKDAENRTVTAQRQAEGWKSAFDSNTGLHDAQYQQSKAQKEGLKRLWLDVYHNAGELERHRVNEGYQQGQELEKQIKVKIDYIASNGEMLAATSGITGSDQTGASIYGYRNDTSWKEPQSYWSDHQKSQYDRLSRDNPGLAESYAATINDAYHQQQLKQNQRKVEAEVNSNNGLAVLHNIGARIGSQFKGLDGINSALEYAGRGRITTNPELTPGTYAQTVDDATYNRVRNQHGEAAADVYDQFTKAFDGIASYVTTGPTGHAIKSGFETGTDALNEAQKNGASDLEAVAHAFTTGVSGATLDIGLNKFFSDTEKFENIPTLKKISESAAINISKAVVDGLSQEIILQDNSTYNSIIKEQMKKGFSKEQATRIALWELAKTPVKGTLEDLSITPAQHRFYESAQRKIGSQIK